jgi:lysophospholipase L1-like esterase
MIKTCFPFLILLLLSSNIFAASMSTSAGSKISGGSSIGATLNTNYLLPLGDSITQGSGSPTLLGYRLHLQDLLGIRKYTFVGSETSPTTPYLNYQSNNGGIPSQTAAQILSRTSTEIANMVTPISNLSAVLIHAGTNDAFGGGSSNINTTMNSIISTINTFNPNVQIYVALITPVNLSWNSTVTALNANLKTDLQTQQATYPQLHIVDINSAFLADASWATDYMYSDNEHPNDAGYIVMANTWYSCMQSSLNTYCDGH